MSGSARRLAAPWVLPIEGPPIAEGAVLVGGDGRIVAVGPDQAVPAPPGVPSERLLDAVLLPGLINTHTHLELTGFDGQVSEEDFPAWIRRLIALKAVRTPAEFLHAARQGIRDGWAAGVTSIADTGDTGAAIEALNQLDASGVAYHEVFGPHPDQAEAAITSATRRLDELAPFTGPRVRLGLSPHAPYSVSGPLYRRVAELAAARSLPMAVHLAESEEESLLLEQGSGGFARAWEARGIPLPSMPGCSPVAWLEQHGVLSPRTLCIHLVRADAADLDLLARRGVAVAHCPRSNRRHARRPAPLAQMLARGLRVGVGTDSVASISPPDLLAEVRAAQALAGLAAEPALQLATVDAARALGLEGEVGSLSPGKWGDLIGLDLPGTVDAGHLAGTVLARLHNDVRLTVVAGRVVYRRPKSVAG